MAFHYHGCNTYLQLNERFNNRLSNNLWENPDFYFCFSDQYLKKIINFTKCIRIGNQKDLIIVRQFDKQKVYNNLIMSTLQKKRDEFRKEIRKNQLDKYRQQKRKALFHQQINLELLKKIDHVFEDLEEYLAQTTPNLRAQNSMAITSASFKDEPANIKQILGCFHQLKSMAPYEYEQIFTKYMLDKKSAQRLIRIFTDLIANEVDSDDEIEHQVQEKYNPIIRVKTLLEILKFLDTLSYMVMGQDSILQIIGGLWNMVTDQVLFDEIEKFGILQYTLSIFGKLFEDLKSHTIYSNLLERGIGQQIVNLMGRLQSINVPLEIHEYLLIFINNYLSCELSFQPEVHHQIGQITINTSTVNQKQTMIAYCVVFLAKREVSLYPIVLPVISKIIEIHEFMTGSFKDEYLIQICELILHKERKIQVEALNLLNDLSYHSPNCIDHLLAKGSLLDILHKRLSIERTNNDQNVNPCVQKIAYIICNCLLTQKLNLKRQALSHYIWQEVYMSLQPSNKLFPLIMTMTYFLDAIGHKNFQKYLLPYVEALRNFEWDHCKYNKQIKYSIENIFYKANQHWQEHQCKKLLSILYQNGLFALIQDFCDPEIVHEIKEGSME